MKELEKIARRLTDRSYGALGITNHEQYDGLYQDVLQELINASQTIYKHEPDTPEFMSMLLVNALRGLSVNKLRVLAKDIDDRSGKTVYLKGKEDAGEGIKEALKKQREICADLIMSHPDIHNTQTGLNICDYVIADLMHNAPEPEF